MGTFEKGVMNVNANVCWFSIFHVQSNAWLLSFECFASCCNAKIYGKIVLNEEIPVNKYQKKIHHMTKLVEMMFIISKC